MFYFGLGKTILYLSYCVYVYVTLRFLPKQHKKLRNDLNFTPEVNRFKPGCSVKLIS